MLIGLCYSTFPSGSHKTYVLALEQKIKAIDDPAAVVEHAEENIKRYTKSDFTQAWHYEFVRSVALALLARVTEFVNPATGEVTKLTTG